MDTNTRQQLSAQLFERVAAEAVQEDMARIYGEERRKTPRDDAPPRELQPIFSRRQAE